MVEGHHQVLRDQIHKIQSQLQVEGITVNFEDVVSEAVYAKNVMTSVGGYSPYQALFGRNASLLTDLETSSRSTFDDENGALPGGKQT